MPARALLIGSGYGGLPVDPGVDRVAAWLHTRAFAPAELHRLTGAAATRAQILAGLADLAARDHGDAPVVVYYAGHGYLYRSGGDADGYDHIATPLLVPVGLRRTAAGIQYGVLAHEFTRALQAIAARARNLTVILDCCHAAAMLHLDAAPDSITTLDNLHTPNNLHTPDPLAHVVVLTASSAGGRAHVDPVRESLIFTDALLAAVARCPTWDAALADARGQVQAVFPAQQPGLFGPRFRRPLGLDEQLPAGELFHVEHAPDGPPMLLAGAARDLHLDDEFDLLDLATTTYGPADILATARPADLRVDRCRLVPDAGPLPRRNCYARRSRRGRPPALDLRPLLGHPLHAPLRARLPELGLVPADDTPRPCIGRLEPAHDRLHVRDPLGELVHTDILAAPDPDALARCLRRLDRWHDLSRWLRADSSARPLRRYYGLEWRPEPRDPARAAMTRGDHLTVTLHNLDRGESELHVQALRVRPDRSVLAWSGAAESLVARQRHDLRLRLDDPGDGLPPGDYREWTFVVVANHAFPLSDLITPQELLTGRHLSGRHLETPGAPDHEAIELLAFPYGFTRA